MTVYLRPSRSQDDDLRAGWQNDSLRGYNGGMAITKPSPFPFPPKRMYSGANIPMRMIRRYARAIAEEFQPDKIILFGSYAYGTPHEDSDVDLLVIMPARDCHSQTVRILYRLDPPVRSTSSSAPRKKLPGDWKTGSRSPRRSCRRERCCMKMSTREWDKKAEADHVLAMQGSRSKIPVHDGVCFLCQQCAEKYLKG